MKKTAVVLAALLRSSASLYAHHGVASLGAAGLEGPGAPVETSTSATLPEGSFLAYYKLDHAEMKKDVLKNEVEGDFNTFTMYGFGYGATPWFSLYAFLPYHAKMPEEGMGTAGFADMSVMAVVGFTYDHGLKLVPANESLDDMEDWHFTVYGGSTLPTGDPKRKDENGDVIDPGMQLGFGNPALTLGATATKFLGDWTGTADVAFNTFGEYEFSDGEKTKFGDEFRINAAGIYRAVTNPAKKFRLDLSGELNYLSLGRDEVNGQGEDATGGNMIYTTLGTRLYKDSSSLALGLKLPVWTNLNEEDDQQGAEGKESYRFLLTFSTLF